MNNILSKWNTMVIGIFFVLFQCNCSPIQNASTNKASKKRYFIFYDSFENDTVKIFKRKEGLTDTVISIEPTNSIAYKYIYEGNLARIQIRINKDTIFKFSKRFDEFNYFIFEKIYGEYRLAKVKDTVFAIL